MSDDEAIEKIDAESGKLTVVSSNILEKHGYGDKNIEKAISEIVDDIIQADVRISNTPETRQALRNNVRMEIILSLKCEKAIKRPDSITTADERMIRSAVKMSMDLMSYVYDDVKGKPGKEIEIGLVREQVKKRVIKATKDVDILG